MKPVATAVITCARPDGLVAPLVSMAAQDFAEPWELLVVNWGFGEQDELLRALWARLRPDIPLRHVPLLPPLSIHGKHSSWHMGTTFNTAWTHAQGEFCAVIEDFWVFGPTWLSKHVECQRAQGLRGNFIVGYNHALPLWDENAPWHYGVEAIIMVNFSHQTEIVWRDNGLGAPEWPTRHPETTILPYVFCNRNSLAIRQPIRAWHQEHYPGGGFGYVMQKTSYTSGDVLRYLDGTPFDGIHRYLPVEPMQGGNAYVHEAPNDWNCYRRNVREERQKLGYWT